MITIEHKKMSYFCHVMRNDNYKSLLLVIPAKMPVEGSIPGWRLWEIWYYYSNTSVFSSSLWITSNISKIGPNYHDTTQSLIGEEPYEEEYYTL